MRKGQRKLAGNYIKLLNQTHNGLKKAFDLRRYSIAAELLEQCQEIAIKLGELIESSGGSNPSIPLLEDYCELVYQIYEKTRQNDAADSYKTCKMLRKNIVQVENIIRNDTDTHVEAVFLPYKASMWDSLESVWKAANEDPDCDAYVIPIPYYDKNPDGSFREEHYEGDLYPDYVPITRYDEFDFEIHQPDMVFIHNPYDKDNYVTSIHPQFYSEQLKLNTNLLVYIPYYITLDPLPEHLCVTLGSINADWIIVQSESLRQNYIYSFKKIGKEKGWKEIYKDIKKKVLALGSPKFDKVILSEQSDFEIPDDWRYLIESGGTKRKVVFYNTSLGAMLNGNEQYLKKLRSVLKLFQGRKDVTLWWRPHPLSEATVNSMLPSLIQEYEKIIKEYRQAGWGIFDDTPDLHRAIAWSDAYYGDKSSVEVLFHAAGKPVMQQETEDLPLVFENFICADGNYWFTSCNSNGLFRMDCKTWKADFMGCFPTEKNCSRLYFSINQYGNLLVFTPFSANQIALYRLDTFEFISIPLQEFEKQAETTDTTRTEEADMLPVPYFEQRKFSFCAVYQGYAFLFPCTYPAIVKVNLSTYQIEYLYEPIKKLSEIIKHPQYDYFRKGVQDGNIVKLWCIAANAFVEFNMITCQLDIHSIIDTDTLYVEAVYDGITSWLFPKTTGGKLLKTTMDGTQNTFIDLPESGISGYPSYLYAINTEDAIYAFPATAKHVVKIDKKQNRAEYFPLLDSEKAETLSEPSTDWQFLFAEKSGDTIFAYDAFAHKLVSFNLLTGDIRKEAVWVTPEIHADSASFLKVWELYYEWITQEQELAVKEERRKSLNAFLELVTKQEASLLESLHKVRKRLSQNGGIQITGNCGQSIYKHTKNYLLKEQRKTL